MSPAESEFDELTGSVFYVFGSDTVVQYYETVGVFCEFDDISKNVFHFVVIASYRKYVGVLQVLPVLTSLARSSLSIISYSRCMSVRLYCGNVIRYSKSHIP